MRFQEYDRFFQSFDRNSGLFRGGLHLLTNDQTGDHFCVQANGSAKTQAL
jgi:hypothetical protein